MLLLATELGVKDQHPYLIEEMPSAMSFTAQVVFCMIFEDVTFYFSHRLLH
jgi:sterol desaturase/sphingolipid hydroxylase (fatty acid hydroxylase superfamily)